MRTIREILRLKLECGLSARQIARTSGLARSTVGDYVARFHASGLPWPPPQNLSDSDLERHLFQDVSAPKGLSRPEPDWQYVHQELRRKGVTLLLLWQEYKATHPEGFQYAWFCEAYRVWHGKRDLVMRQHHLAGEKLFVDFSGTTIPYVNRHTGEIHKAEIFVAVMGASNYTFVMALESQQVEHWILGHVKAFEFLGGTPAIVVPDNLKSGVTKACRYEPMIQSSYAEMAQHYGVAIIPARVRKPKDKAKVEGGVLLVQRWILAKLRNQMFFSVSDINYSIRALLKELNERPFKKLSGSRQSLFDLIDKPALGPLPDQAYEFAQWKIATLNIDYHVEVDDHYYSAPYQLARKALDVRWTLSTVEIFHQSLRVASHLRIDTQRRHTTLDEHMPPHHRNAEFSPQRFLQWAQRLGPATAALIEHVLNRRRHVQQSYRTCLGILRLGDRFGSDRLEGACRRAILINAYSCRSLRSILENGLDGIDPNPAPEQSTPEHENVRGPDYYN